MWMSCHPYKCAWPINSNITVCKTSLQILQTALPPNHNTQAYTVPKTPQPALLASTGTLGVLMQMGCPLLPQGTRQGCDSLLLPLQTSMLDFLPCLGLGWLPDERSGKVSFVLFFLLIIQQDWQAALRVFTFHLPSGSWSSNGCSFGWSRYSCGIRNILLMALVQSMDRPVEKAWLWLQQLCWQKVCITSCPLPWWERRMPSTWYCQHRPSSTATVGLVAHKAAHPYGKESWKNTPKLEVTELLHDALSIFCQHLNATRFYALCVSQIL